MGLNLAQKIIKEHLVSGEMVAGSEISIRISLNVSEFRIDTFRFG